MRETRADPILRRKELDREDDLKYLVMAAVLAFSVYSCSQAEPADQWWISDGTTWRVRLAIPDPHYTTGDVVPVTRAQICSRGWARDMRNQITPAGWLGLKIGIMHWYGYDGLPLREFELDHDVPLEVGGSNSTLNLWPEPIAEARAKDRIENEMHRELCSGQITVDQAQQFFRTNGWAR